MKSLKLKKELQTLSFQILSKTYKVDDPICENINDPLLKDIVRYRNHPSIVAIKKFCSSKSHFSFKNVRKEETLKKLNNLNINRATQNTDIPTKIIKENSDVS